MQSNINFISLLSKLNPKKMKKSILQLILVGFVFLTSCNQSFQTSREDDLYQRVLNSGEIRASYAIYPPYCLQNPNTGEIEGIMVEILEHAAEKLQLKIVWTEEVGWGTIFEGLKLNRYDIFGAGVWRNASRGRVADFSMPTFYNPIKAWGRADETRFIDDLASINAPNVRISVMDGAMDDLIAIADYPLAQHVSVPQLNPWTDVLLNITTRKADVTFAEPGAVRPFLERNPGTLKELAVDYPVRVFAICYAFNLGEERFKAMLNSALEETINEGFVEKVLLKYEVEPGDLLRVALPYQLPSQSY